MTLTHTAIVLRRQESGESDRRLTLLTEDAGKVTAVAKGARKANSRLAGVSEPLSYARYTLAAGKVNRFVTQSEPIAAFRALRRDFDRLSYALGLAELYGVVLPEQQPDPEAFDLLRRSLEALESHPRPDVALLWAETKLMEHTGFFPSLDACVDTGEGIVGDSCWLSPMAGGVVSDLSSNRYGDRLRSSPEIVTALLRLPEFEEPPSNVKRTPEALLALVPFWRNIAESNLPAHSAAMDAIRLVVAQGP
ncbi:DNA repair protein RecO [bacterium]|nr:MAG: DNA repair protein RecO [bacterium]